MTQCADLDDAICLITPQVLTDKTISNPFHYHRSYFFSPLLQTAKASQKTFIMSSIGDHIWLLVGEQLQYNLSTLHALCLVSTRFCNIFTPLLYRHVSLFAIHKRHLKLLSQSPYVRYTRTLNIACLEAQRYVTQEWVDFSAALEKMSNLRELEYAIHHPLFHKYQLTVFFQFVHSSSRR